MKAIASSDSSELIDNIDGVTPISILENVFTCEDFLETIGY